MQQENDRARRFEAKVSRRSMLAMASVAGVGAASLGSMLPTVRVDAAMMMPGSQADGLSKAMRRLWEEHIAWTRLFIVSFAAGLPDLTPTTQRLLRNQVDIGNAIMPFYGQAAGVKLTTLLRQHILGAATLLEAAKAGNTAKVAQSKSAWYANANEIASFLHTANPQHWQLDAMKQMMRRHLDLTLKESVARLQGKYSADIAAYDRVETEILGMADMLTAGIVAQFPQRFTH
jgi:hypothetical protein